MASALSPQCHVALGWTSTTAFIILITAVCCHTSSQLEHLEFPFLSLFLLILFVPLSFLCEVKLINQQGPDH